MQIRNGALHLFCLIVILSSIAVPFFNPQPIAARPDKLAWSIINTPNDTPDSANQVVFPNSEVNFIAVGADDLTIYALDVACVTPNSKLYKSTDNGITWNTHLTTQLTDPDTNASPPFWNIAVAPDNADIIAVVTSDGSGLPREVFISTDGGGNWDNTGLNSVIGPGMLISCIDISPVYGSNQHDIAVGTRITPANGAVYVLKTPGVNNWKLQTDIPSLWTQSSNVIALKFSPNYDGDSGLVAVTSTFSGGTGGTYIDQGWRDTGGNTTTWHNLISGAGLVELTTGSALTSPRADQIVTADIELPSDFNATDPAYQRYYISYDDNMATSQSGIYRLDYNIPLRLFSSIAATRISSIAYFGTYSSGNLLAGQVTIDPSTGTADLWKTTDPAGTTLPPLWTKAQKPPTGAANPVNPFDLPANWRFLANAQVAWNPSGDRVYCGTSSADLAPAAVDWPNGYLNNTAYDESAFSVSPYSAQYRAKLEKYNKPADDNFGNIWNQTGLIDTEITRLRDVAVLEVPSSSTGDYNIIYLSSANLAPGLTNNFASVWRSIPDENDNYTWERVSIVKSDNGNLILRVYSGNSYYSLSTRSRAVVFADLNTDLVRYSGDEGQLWDRLLPFIAVSDMALENSTTIFIADSTSVRKGIKSGSSWTWSAPVFTGLNTAHSIKVLPENSQSTLNGKRSDEWVVVGEEIIGRVAYCDFSGTYPRTGTSPRFEITSPLPISGRTHIVLNDEFAQNRMITAAVVDSTGFQGKIYRWIIGQKEPDWLELQPLNRAFYGAGIIKDVLYGIWQVAVSAGTAPGVDRTLYSTQDVPPPMEWDDLTYNLPNTGIQFTCEPVALKTSWGDYNNLWAIDNRNYLPANQVGCLWAYTDTLARRGPFPSAPAAGGLAPFDPVSGRAGQINFQWFQLIDAGVYELVVAKDEAFTKLAFQVHSIIPYNQNAPTWILAAGNVLEEGHKYFWRVRAVGSIQGEIIHSPWSATMYFTVMKGLPVNTQYNGPALLYPANACGCSCDAPSNFSWSPYLNTNKYLFQLSDKPNMSTNLISTEVPGTAYQYSGKLKCGASYYWRVRAVAPFPSEWSSTFTFSTLPQETTSEVSEMQKQQKNEATTAFFITLMIVIGTLLVICVLILIMRTRRRYW